eukprot:1138859-Pelagomonas_calceolata.AAC.5
MVPVFWRQQLGTPAAMPRCPLSVQDKNFSEHLVGTRECISLGSVLFCNPDGVQVDTLCMLVSWRVQEHGRQPSRSPLALFLAFS